MNRLLAASAALVLTAGAAGAATVAFGPAAPTGNSVILATDTDGVVFENQVGNILNTALSPFDSDSNTATEDGDADSAFEYTSISANSTATYEFGVTGSSISFIWGSPDTYNTLTFLSGGANGTVVDTFVYSGPTGSNLANSFATVTASGLFDTVVFGSINSNAFEFADLSIAAIPLPAAGLLLVGAIGALGIARRRKA